jgi:hypothetical protein
VKKIISLFLIVTICTCSGISAQILSDSEIKKTIIQEHVDFEGWPNCIKISNGSVELIITTDVGPRIIRFGYIGGQNMFYVSPIDKGKSGGNDWHVYGGHRLWLAPEATTLSYDRDNSSVKYSWDGKTLKLSQNEEQITSIVKEFEITLSKDKNEVKVLHRIINKGCWSVELSPWSITACAAGGRAIVPQEPYIDPTDYILPIRPIVLWAYTKMADSRYIWGDKFIQATQDPSISSETKFGLLNKQEWAAFYLNNNLFVKTFEYDKNALYTDFGCNNEIYINGDFLEVESLGPHSKLLPQCMIEHVEYWYLHKATINECENSIEKNLMPLLNFDTFK